MRSKPLLPKKKKPNIPWVLRVIKWAFPRVERLAPRLAFRWFVKLFFSPPRYPIPASERQFIMEATSFQLSVWEITVRCYRWGQGPLIVFVHGWAGRASQFKAIIPFFTNAGYQVISFDAPAHGASAGKEATIIDFKNTMLAVEKYAGRAHAVVAHSLGGAASLYAMTEGLRIDTLVTLSTPSIGDNIIQEFSQRLGASVLMGENLKTYIQHRLHRPFDDFMASYFAKQLPSGLRWLIIHDEDDKEASLENAVCLKQHYPDATLLITRGLGHVRILRDEAVIEAALRFVMERDHPAAVDMQTPVVMKSTRE